jgi:hypothetical protein
LKLDSDWVAFASIVTVPVTGLAGAATG